MFFYGRYGFSRKTELLFQSWDNCRFWTLLTRKNKQQNKTKILPVKMGLSEINRGFQFRNCKCGETIGKSNKGKEYYLWRKGGNLERLVLSMSPLAKSLSPG